MNLEKFDPPEQKPARNRYLIVYTRPDYPTGDPGMEIIWGVSLYSALDHFTSVKGHTAEVVSIQRVR